MAFVNGHLSQWFLYQTNFPQQCGFFGIDFHCVWEFTSNLMIFFLIIVSLKVQTLVPKVRIILPNWRAWYFLCKVQQHWDLSSGCRGLKPGIHWILPKSWLSMSKRIWGGALYFFSLRMRLGEAVDALVAIWLFSLTISVAWFITSKSRWFWNVNWLSPLFVSWVAVALRLVVWATCCGIWWLPVVWATFNGLWTPLSSFLARLFSQPR